MESKINGSDKNVGSIEKDMKKIDSFIAMMKSDFRTGLYYKDKLEAIENLIKGYRELIELLATERLNNKVMSNTINNSIPKSKIKEIVDECIPKGKNIITGKEEYQPNTNANSFLTQSILELMEDK